MKLSVAAALLVCASSYRWYGNALPPAVVPCPPEGAPGCRGTGFCEAYGHVDCYTAGEEGSIATGFGKSVQTAVEKAPSRGWNTGLCAADDDGDGFTNGDELGDGCCAWPLVSLAPLGAISNPSWQSSTPPFPSCSSSTVKPQPPARPVASPVGTGAIQVTWSAPNASLACACEHWAAVYNSSTGSTAGTPLATTYLAGRTVTFCDLPPGANVTVAIAGVHRGGRGNSTTIIVPVPSTGSPPATSCTPLSQSYRVIDAANTTAAVAMIKALATRPRDLPPTTGVAWVALCALAIAIPAFVATCCSRDPHHLRRYTVHRYLPSCCVWAGAPPPAAAAAAASRGSKPTPLPSAAAPGSSGDGGSGRTGVSDKPPAAGKRGGGGGGGGGSTLVSRCCASTCSRFASDLQQAGIGHTVAVVLAAVALAAATAQTFAWYNWLYFPLGTRYAISRACGYGAAIGMGLQLLPVTRFSLWAKLLGVPFERALILHRWAGWMTVILTIIHGVWIGVGYALDGPFTVDYLFVWTTMDAVNPLAGFISGTGMMLLAMTSWNPVRRRLYELFIAGHLLWPVIFIMAFLHIQHSDTPAVPLSVLGLALLGIDVLLMGLDALVMRNAVVVDCGLCFPDGSLISCSSIVGVQAAAAAAATASSDKFATSAAVAAGPAPPAASPSGLPLPPAARTLVNSTEASIRMLQQETAAFVVLDKHPTAACGPGWWPFRYAPGQYVYIAFPGATNSMFPHPISISSAPDIRPIEAGGAPGRFTVTIKPMGEGTWSAKLAASIRKVLHARARQMAPPEASTARPAASPQAVVVSPAPTLPAADAASAIPTGPQPASSPDGAATPSTGAVAMPGQSTRLLAGVSGHLAAGIVPLTPRGDASVGHAWPVPDAGALLPPSTQEAVIEYASAACGSTAGPPPMSGTDVLLPIPAEVRHIMRAWVTGPFGAPSVQLHHAKHFVLFAGGVGVTPIASLHQSLATGVPVEPHLSTPVKVRTLTTVWAVRDKGLVAAFAPVLTTRLRAEAAATTRAGAAATEDTAAPDAGSSGREDEEHAAEAAAASGNRVSVTVYGGSGSAGGGPTTAGDGIQLKGGRPNIAAILREARDKAVAFDMTINKRSTFVAVAVCGPDEMVRAVIAAAQELNAASGNASGRVKPVSATLPVYFAVHRETFMM